MRLFIYVFEYAKLLFWPLEGKQPENTKPTLFFCCFRRNIKVTSTTLAFVRSCVCVHLMNINAIAAL